jgi:integrase
VPLFSGSLRYRASATTRVRRISCCAPDIEAIIAVPDRRTWLGRRSAQTGLRLSELIGLDQGCRPSWHRRPCAMRW